MSQIWYWLLLFFGLSYGMITGAYILQLIQVSISHRFDRLVQDRLERLLSEEGVTSLRVQELRIGEHRLKEELQGPNLTLMVEKPGDLEIPEVAELDRLLIEMNSRSGSSHHNNSINSTNSLQSQPLQLDSDHHSVSSVDTDSQPGDHDQNNDYHPFQQYHPNPPSSHEIDFSSPSPMDPSLMSPPTNISNPSFEIPNITYQNTTRSSPESTPSNANSVINSVPVDSSIPSSDPPIYTRKS